MRAERTAAYTATQIVTVDGRASEVVHIWRDGRKQRLEWDEPSVRRGDVMVDDGVNVWLYHRQENAATQTKSTNRNQSRGAAWAKNFKIRPLGAQVISGRKTHGVEITARDGLRGTRRFFIDDATKIVMRRERIPVGGSRESSELRSIKFGAVSPAKFAWSPPAGANVTRTSGSLFTQVAVAKRNAPWLRVPQSVPGGYQFESAVVDGSKGEAWLRYSTGTRRFSIFQQRAKEGGDRTAQAVDGGLYWQRNGSRFLIIGVAEQAARRIADSVR